MPFLDLGQKTKHFLLNYLSFPVFAGVDDGQVQFSGLMLNNRRTNVNFGLSS